MPSNSAPVSQALRVRLLWLTLFRTALAATLLVVLGARSSLNARTAPIAAPDYVAFALLAVVFLVTLVTALLLRTGEVRSAAAWTHVAFDALLSTVVVAMTGGPESPFAFLFLLAIIGAAMLLGRAGAFSSVVASMAAVSLLSTRPWQADAVWRGFDLATHLAAQALMGVLSAYAAALLLRSEAGRSASEEGLKRLTALHQQIVTALPAGVLTCDASWRLTFINPAAQAILGTEPERETLEGLLVGAQDVRRHEVRLHTHRGERILGLSRTALSEDGATLVVFQDLTELRRLEGELERIDRLASLGRVAAELAHEIRNPLAAMRGAAQMLAAEAETSQARLASLIVREADRLAALVDGSLRLVHPAPPSRVRVGLEGLVRETLEMLRAEPALAAVEVELAPVEASVDVSQMRQVLINLLRNAAAAVASGGRIAVRTRLEEGQPCIDVWDSAGAVAEADRERIFEPFYTKSAGGTGLGLCTVRSITHAHGGHVSVTSTPSTGTTFTVVLPPPSR